jgi:hypothetical protein
MEKRYTDLANKVFKNMKDVKFTEGNMKRFFDTMGVKKEDYLAVDKLISEATFGFAFCMAVQCLLHQNQQNSELFEKYPGVFGNIYQDFSIKFDLFLEQFFPVISLEPASDTNH